MIHAAVYAWGWFSLWVVVTAVVWAVAVRTVRRRRIARLRAALDARALPVASRRG